MASNKLIKTILADAKLKAGKNPLLWDLSGSALVHILIILGLGFYVSLPDIAPLPLTISVNLSSGAALSESTQIGAGSKAVNAQTPASQSQQENIISIESSNPKFNARNDQSLIRQNNLLEEIKRRNQLIQASERVGFLGTHEIRPAYQAYQEYWREYVGEFGTQHYPSELIKNKLDGQLELDIAINTEGVLQSVTIHRSSGNPAIDEAAINIAEQASPYAPLPAEMAKDIDILHIIRTWHFNNQTLISNTQG